MPVPDGVGDGDGDALGATEAFAPASGLAPRSGLTMPPLGSADGEGVGLGVGEGEGDGVAACAPFFLLFVFGAGEGAGVAGGTLKRSRHEYPSIVDGHLNPVCASLIAYDAVPATPGEPETCGLGVPPCGGMPFCPYGPCDAPT